MNFYKIFILVFLILLVFKLNSQNVYDNSTNSDSIKELCTIRNVKKAKGFNVIFAKVKSNGYLIIILSKSHCKRKNIIDKIECGKDYNFVLHPLYNFSEKYFPMIVDVAKYKIMDKKLKIKGSHYLGEIYTSPSLIGLYYCPV